MRLANVQGRAHLAAAVGWLDVHEASAGRWATPAEVFGDWLAFRRWADTGPSSVNRQVDKDLLGAPSPGPRQVVAIGLNDRAHAAESGLEAPAVPPTFTKYLSSLVGPYCEVTLPSNTVDGEAELVAEVPHADATCS